MTQTIPRDGRTQPQTDAKTTDLSPAQSCKWAIDRIAVRRESALADLGSRGGASVRFTDLVVPASAVCNWCGMSAYEAVCGDCCMLRLVGALLDGHAKGQLASDPTSDAPTG